MTFKFKNNAYSTLSASLTNVATTLSVQTGHGDRFPAVTAPDVAYITLEDSGGNREIVKVTARTAGADSMTIVRAQEGTSARSWVSGDTVEQRITAGELDRYETMANVDDATSKTTPVDADYLPLKDSAASNGLKYLTWANLKATLAAYWVTVANVWTAVQTFRVSGGIRVEAAATQDAIAIAGRAGGTGSYEVTITPATLTADRTATMQDATGTIPLLEADQAWTGSQRGTPTADNDLSFDLNAANNFNCTPTAGGALTFTNHVAGQSGFVLLVNGSNYAITAAATTKVDSSLLATISATGTYLLSYYDNGTNTYIVGSKDLS